MHRIDTPTAQTDKFGAGKNGFMNGDPSTGRRATDLNSDMWDAVQEEICAVIEKSNMALNKDQHDQLYQAIVKIITSKIPDALLKKNNLSDVLDKAVALANLNGVPKTTKVNGKALTDNIDLSSQDIFSKFVILGNNVDLNTLTTPGIYVVPNNAQAASGTNYPEPYAGLIVVYPSAGVTQIYRVYGGSRTHSRSQHAGVWSDRWARVYDSENPPPPSSTTQKGIVQLSSATDSDSEVLAATPKAVKVANENANGRVPSTRSINGHTLDTDTNVTAKDIFNGQAVEIGAQGNLNNMTDAGLYFQPTNANASIARNYPEAQAGALMVLKTTGCIQLYFVYGSSRRYSRAYYSGTWTQWYLDYNAGNLPEASTTKKGIVQLVSTPGSSQELGMTQAGATNLNNTNIGQNQSVRNVTASRAAGVTYTNSTGKPIAVSLKLVGGVSVDAQVNINTIDAVYTASRAEFTAGAGLYFIVPVAGTYKVTTSSPIIFWVEMS